MAHETILYISDHATNSDSVIIELEATGYDVVSTDSSPEGMALLYIMHSVKNGDTSNTSMNINNGPYTGNNAGDDHAVASAALAA